MKDLEAFDSTIQSKLGAIIKDINRSKTKEEIIALLNTIKVSGDKTVSKLEELKLNVNKAKSCMNAILTVDNFYLAGSGNRLI